MAKFNREAFVVAFEASLQELQKAEQVTKRELRELSRSTLEALHSEGDLCGDIGYINRLLGALSPVNARAAVVYFEEFSGFNTNDTRTLFTKKNRAQYPECKSKAEMFLADPDFNIWTWSRDRLEMEKKPFAVEKVGQVVKKAIKENVSQADIIREVLKNGVEVESIIAMLGELIPAEKQEEAMGKIADGFGMEVV